MASCNNFDVATIESSRIFFNFSDRQNCGRKTAFYGDNCQLAEIDGVTEEVRGSSNVLRAWNRYTGEFCTVGSTKTPPALTEVTVRFQEICAPGLPFADTLDDCRWQAIVNHGPCYNVGSAVDGWSQYTEVYDLLTRTKARGRRNSFNGEDAERTIEITAELHNYYQFGPMQFSPIDLGDTCIDGELVACDIAFGCKRGCGESSCGCREACDDGTQTFYAPIQCAGGANQLLYTTNSGGENAEVLTLPVGDGGDPSACAKVAECANILYVLAYENPTVLLGIRLDSTGLPTGSWTQLAVLSSTGGDTGQPAHLECCNDTLNILVYDVENGSRFYSQSSTFNAANGQRHVFETSARIQHMSCCGQTIVVGGVQGALEVSVDGGNGWASMPLPTGFDGDITSVEVNDLYIWIGSDNGQKYYTADQGFTWTTLLIPGGSGTSTDISFSGDNIGWIADSSGRPFSTWLGGLNQTEWSNDTPRYTNFPTGFVPNKIAIPECANTQLMGNTGLFIGSDINGATAAYIGRPLIAGIS